VSDSPNSTAAALAAALLEPRPGPADASGVDECDERADERTGVGPDEPTRDGVVARTVEVGVGRRHDVAAALVERGVAVTATDVVACDAPPGVAFVRDDVTDPEPWVYADAGLVYALNCPPELQRPARDVACEAGAVFRFTTLGGDPAVVPAAATSVGDETLFTASPRNGPTRE
jgi:uncharacterized UPF0146 family protein